MRSFEIILATAVVAASSVRSVADEGIYTPGEPVLAEFGGFPQAFLDRHCLECHDDVTTEGNLNLLELGPVDETNAAVWKSVWAQVSLREMPPEKKTPPEVVTRLRFSDWIVGELQREMADKGGFRDHLDSKKGNFLEHDLLFGQMPEGIKLVPTSSPARIWRISPQEYITRLNEFVNIEPKYNPSKPGLRTHGDVVPTNHAGELNLYFGLDRLQGGVGSRLIVTLLKNTPVALSSDRKHGLENYADHYSVNGAETTQIVAMADDILRYMAYGLPESVTDNPRNKGNAPNARIYYSNEVVRPLTPVYDLMKEPGVSEQRLRAAVDYLFEALTFRPPTPDESDAYMNAVENSIARIGKEDGVFLGLSAIFLERDALFRPETARNGEPDRYGRVMLKDWELGLAVNHALRYLRPDETLRQAILDGRMRTREDVRREVTRMLEDDSIRKPRVLQFFRDYFDHDLAGYICKDEKLLGNSGRINPYRTT